MNFNSEVSIIWDRDHDVQMQALDWILHDIRKIHDDKIRAIEVAALRDMGAFYIPAHDYLTSIFGNRITNPGYGIYYTQQVCSLYDRLVFPMRIFDGTVIGFVGYSDDEIDLFDDGSAMMVKYLFPSKDIFDKSRYMFCEPEWYRGAIRDGYVCLVEGIFDAFRLNAHGIHAIATCGTRLTRWHRIYLSFIPKIVTIGDNDGAGKKLVRRINYETTGSINVSVHGVKDIDEMLRTPEAISEFYDRIQSAVRAGLPIGFDVGERQVTRIAPSDYKPIENEGELGYVEENRGIDSDDTQKRGQTALERIRKQYRPRLANIQTSSIVSA